jgi:hypothetical protein
MALAARRIWEMCCWTQPSCGRIRARRERQKNGGQTAQALGRSRGGFSCKIHLAAEGLGYPLRLTLTGGQSHEITRAQALMDGLDCDHAIADRAYAAQHFIDWLIEREDYPRHSAPPAGDIGAGV